LCVALLPPAMASLQFGKASACFPLAISHAAVLGTLEQEGELFSTTLVGYTTQKTLEAGAASIRVRVDGDASSLKPGALLVAVRADGHEGWLPGLAASRCGGSDTSEEAGLEIVVFGRPDKAWQEVMYLSEDILKILFQTGDETAVRVLMPLAPVQHDCPPQWLRDHLLRLADGVNETYAGANSLSSSEQLQKALSRAGIAPEGFSRQVTMPPADAGDRVGQTELGYWNEEMAVGHRCNEGLGGSERLDGPGILVGNNGLDGQ